MSTEGPQQPSIPLGATATDRSSGGRGRGRGRSRGRGRGQGRGGRSSFQHQSTAGASLNVDQQQSQSPATALRPQGVLRSAPSSTDRHAATDRHSARQHEEQQSVAHSSQEAKQPRQRSQRPRHRGYRHRSEQTQHTSLGSARPDSTSGLMLPQDSALQLPDCIICCEPVQVQRACCKLVLKPFCDCVALCMTAKREQSGSTLSSCLQVVAIGKCNHKSVCGRCSLRLIMLYQDTKCPLCKTDLEQVNYIPCVHGMEKFASCSLEKRNKTRIGMLVSVVVEKLIANSSFPEA